jgi:hypothetical protein
MSVPAAQAARTVAMPQRWPLIQQQSNRSESFLKDARILNCFAEQDQITQEWIIQKRIGYKVSYSPGGLGLGMYPFGFSPSRPWNDNYAIQSTSSSFGQGNAQLWRGTGAIGPANMDPLGCTGRAYAFVQDQASPNHLIMAGSQHIYYLTSADTAPHVVPAISGAGQFVRGLAYLDQTIYYMDENGVIYNSAFNDPSTWTGSQITANMRAGSGVQLVQQLNYVIALKTDSMEVFYDAVNPPPGSPLSQVPGGVSPYGAVMGTPQVIDDILLYVTSDNTVSPQVIRVDSLQPTVISTPPIERLLDQLQAAGFLQPPGGAAATFVSWVFKHGGHRFYGLTFPFYLLDEPGTVSKTQLGVTVVYDIDQRLWYQWTDENGNFWPVVSMSYDNNNRHLLQGMSDGKVHWFEGDYEYPTDNGQIVKVDVYTPNADFGTRRRKTVHRMYFNSDQTPGSTLYVRRSDDDYQTWSVPRKVDLSRRRPELRNEGTFSRRAYNFYHMAPTPFRVRSVDLQMDMGTI